MLPAQRVQEAGFRGLLRLRARTQRKCGARGEKLKQISAGKIARQMLLKCVLGSRRNKFLTVQQFDTKSAIQRLLPLA
jgi:hypothetical protein